MIKQLSILVLLSLSAGCNSVPPKPSDPAAVTAKAKPAAKPVQVAAKKPAPEKIYDLTHLRPKNHKAIATKYIKTRLKDPSSAQIKVGELKSVTCLGFDGVETDKSKMPKIKVMTADLAVNAKNDHGAYTGNKTYRYHFDDSFIIGQTDLYNSRFSDVCTIGINDPVMKRAK